MKNTSLAAIILFGSVLLTISSVGLYVLGLPLITEMLKDSTVTPELVKSVNIIWVLMSIAVFLCGIWGMFISISIRKNLRYVQKQALSLGSGMLAFGIYGFTSPLPNWKFGVFILIGLLILIPGMLLSKSAGPYQ